MNESEWQSWLERLYSLRRDKRGDHEHPHRPVLLLSIIDLLDRSVIQENAVPLSDELLATFKRYFAVVKERDDKPTIENPFYFLSGDKFWQVIPCGGTEPLYREGYASGAPSVARLRRHSAIGRFDEGLWALMSDAVARHQLREALFARYFPERCEALAALWWSTAFRRRRTYFGRNCRRRQRGTPRSGRQFWRSTTIAAPRAASAYSSTILCRWWKRRI